MNFIHPHAHHRLGGRERDHMGQPFINHQGFHLGIFRKKILQQIFESDVDGIEFEEIAQEEKTRLGVKGKIAKGKGKIHTTDPDFNHI